MSYHNREDKLMLNILYMGGRGYGLHECIIIYIIMMLAALYIIYLQLDSLSVLDRLSRWRKNNLPLDHDGLVGITVLHGW